MKKIVALFLALIPMVAFADRTASCKFEGIPGAYVTAEARFSPNSTVKVNVYSYGVSEASVQVVVNYKYIEAGKEKEGTADRLISISKGKGSGDINVGQKSNFELKSIKVYNAVCNDKKE